MKSFLENLDNPRKLVKLLLAVLPDKMKVAKDWEFKPADGILYYYVTYKIMKDRFDEVNKHHNVNDRGIMGSKTTGWVFEVE